MLAMSFGRYDWSNYVQNENSKSTLFYSRHAIQTSNFASINVFVIQAINSEKNIIDDSFF